jgi:hypothetical protein
VLVPEGALAGHAQALMQLNEQIADFPAPTVVSEDVHGAWAATFGLGGSGQGLRLFGPTGSFTWGDDERVGDERLAVILDEYLFPSPPAAITHVSPGLDLGARVPPTFLDPSFGGIYVRPCPPPPLGSLGLVAKVAFVQQTSDATRATFEALGPPGEDGMLIVVADGADEEYAAALRQELGEDVVTIPDPAGVVADRFGIRHWPTTVTLDSRGIVTSRESSVEPTERTPLAEPNEGQS